MTYSTEPHGGSQYCQINHDNQHAHPASPPRSSRSPTTSSWPTLSPQKLLMPFIPWTWRPSRRCHQSSETQTCMAALTVALAVVNHHFRLKSRSSPSLAPTPRYRGLQSYGTPVVTTRTVGFACRNPVHTPAWGPPGSSSLDIPIRTRMTVMLT